ncbi:MAG: MBOAT family protein [bacterium]|nr:MBOAT family protein [bacterium]
MVFSSLLFLFRFLPIVLVLYFIMPRKLRNMVLFLASLFFYAWGEPVYVVIMLFSTVVDYTHGRMVNSFLLKNDRKKAKMVVASSMIINLCLLGFFKYSDFLIQNINSLFGTSIGLLELSLPIGISFYTFQTMSYTVDVYRGHAKVQRNIISFGTYVALFPQLIAGPIVQYKTIAEQLNHRRESFDQFSDGVVRFVTGLGKKVLLANSIGALWDQISVMDTASLPVATAWIGALAYTFQIYFDFSGYSDMAIGLGKMFGFEFLENFNYPYLSKSITEFWRRWHISLGSWFKEYVYIPLGGNRKGMKIQLRNIAIVWLLTGLWHGASWNFVLWGAYFGVLLLIEKLVLLRWLGKTKAIVGHIYTMFFVIVSWVIFAFEDISKAGNYLHAMFGGGQGIVTTETLYLLSNYGVLFVILIFSCTDAPKRIAAWFRTHSQHRVAASYGYIVLENVFLIAVCILSIAYLVDSSYNPFLYFRF